jgi:MFS transporter, DHA2 family, methylenomycin A resistance protein
MTRLGNPRRPWIDAGPSVVLFTTCLGVLMAALDVSVINLALPHIDRELHAGVSAMQWVVDAYNLCYASLILSGGTVADLYGRRRVFVLGTALFLAGSLGCAWASDAATLILGRAVTGVGAALEFPASLAILSIAFPDPRARGRAIGIWASCHGLAFVIGPTLGGLLVDRAGWRSIFLCAVPVAALAIALSLRAIPESANPHDRLLDPAGQLLAVLALGALSLATIQGPRWGWGSASSLSCFGAAAVSAGLFLLVEARARVPLLPLDLFRSPGFTGACLVAGCMTFGMYAMLFLVPLYLQVVRGASALAVGLELLPLSLAFLWVSRRSGEMATRLGPRLMTTAGMALMGLGLLSLGGLHAHSPLGLVEGDLLFLGLGLGLNTGPMMTVAMEHVAASRAGTGSGVINTTRMVGATLGVAGLGSLFAAQAGERVGDVAHFMSGFRAALWAGGGVLLFGTVVAWLFIEGHPRHQAGVGELDAQPPGLPEVHV